MPTRSRFAATAAAALLACALSGCAGIGTGAASTPAPMPTVSAQSVADACAAVTASVQDATAQLQALDTSSPQAASEGLSQVAARLGDAVAAIDNADVAAVLPDLQTGFARAAEVLQAIAGGDMTQLPALQQAAADIQSSLEKFATLCHAD